MMNYFSTMYPQMGMSLWVFSIIIIWSLVWKLIAFWKSARKNHLVWFIVFAVINTFGILEILYIYVFSKMNSRSRSPSRKAVRRKRR